MLHALSFLQAADGGELLAPEFPGLIGIKEQILRLFRLGLGNLHRQGDRNESGFDGRYEPFLATLE